ncbi:G2/mitotic-specific cyclin S13-7-like [Quercus lobata]|uniref:G2/mitotic-specific cyclin S13-7-like n=1 Tax=Quercus lobata TaxID=97700 RepID=UPI00124508ED|nr:G2/mitotic-specific cyclin S13-7-like [Quercus lobata]
MTIFSNLLGCLKKKKVQHHTHNNVALEQEQRQNTYAFYKHIEKQNQLNTNFLSFQPHVTEYLRDSMVDWLTSLHFSLPLTQPTLFLAVNIFDRFLSVELVLSEHDLKMVAIVALVIASKFEERRFPYALTLMENGVGSNYSQQQIIAMEKNILQKLGWKLFVPTIHFFLVEILDSCGYFDREFKNMAFFFGEVALSDYHATISYSPSTLADSAIYAAMCVLKKSQGSKRRFLNTNPSHSKKEVIFCAEMLQRLANMAPNGKLMRTVSKKAGTFVGSPEIWAFSLVDCSPADLGLNLYSLNHPCSASLISRTWISSPASGSEDNEHHVHLDSQCETTNKAMTLPVAQLRYQKPYDF